MSFPSNTSDKKTCGNPTTTECVFWQGGDISCLNIENGQKISVSIKNVADEICNIKDSLNLEDLDLKCVVDYCLSCPQPDKTLKIILQLLINKVCNIQDLLNDISNATEDTSSNIRLASCFQYVTDAGDLIVELPHEEYTKRIANQVCQIKLELSSLQDEVQDVRDDLNNLTNRVQVLEQSTGDEVSSDCLFTGTRSLDDAFSLLDQAFCQTRSVVGLSTDANLAIAQQCEGLNAEFASNPAWVTGPTNLAQTIRNIWIVLCKRSEEIKTIQTNCCAFDCEDVKIGFVVAFEDGLEVVRLRFTAGSGTNIPNGFTDFGSVLTVSDESGNVLSFNITISNNGEVVLNLLGLNSNDKLTFSIEAKLQNGDLRCQKCVSKVIDASTACNFCTVVNIGSGDAVLIYETQIRG
jgi:archaellum component FlaC